MVLCLPCLGTVHLTLCLFRQGTKGARFLLVYILDKKIAYLL